MKLLFCLLHEFSVWMIHIGYLLMITLVVSSCQGKHVIKSEQSIYGIWIVDDIRIDEGASRTQGHELHEKSYIGKNFLFTPSSVTSNLQYSNYTEGVSCAGPHYLTMKMSLRKLFSGTLGARNYPLVAATPADYEFPDNPRPIDVIAVTCRTGGLGDDEDTPTIPFPDQATWIARIDDRHLVIHWFDDSMLVLSRPDDRQAAAQRAKLLQIRPDPDALSPSCRLAIRSGQRVPESCL